MPYNFWLGEPAENGNKAEPLTSGFGGMDFLWASPVILKAPNGIKGDWLIKTTDKAVLQKKNYQLNPQMSSYAAQTGDNQGAQNLAVVLTGKFPDFYAGKAKPTRSGKDALPDLPTDAKDARVIVVGDSDIASSMLQFNGSDLNMSFLLQAADWLSADSDVASITRHPAVDTRLDKIVDGDSQAAHEFFAMVFNVGVIPLLVLIAALLRILLRKRTEKMMVKNTEPHTEARRHEEDATEAHDEI
jgi:hypothetical protein